MFESSGLPLSLGGDLVKGIWDSLSLWRAASVVLRSRSTALSTLKVLLASIVAWLGLWGCVAKVVGQAQDLYSGKGGHSLLGVCLWASFCLPLYLIALVAYVLPSYQELADAQTRHQRKLETVKRSTDDALTSFCMWIFLWLQQQLLLGLAPPLSSWALSNFANYIHAKALIPFDAASFVVGHLLWCVLYGWYTFDPYLISTSHNLEFRVRLLEQRWAYFVGFGLPLCVLAKTLPFLHNMAAYLFLFPFLVLQAGVLLEAEGEASLAKPVVPRRSLPLFSLARKQTTAAARLITLITTALTPSSKSITPASKRKKKNQ